MNYTERIYPSQMTPIVIEGEGRNERVYDIYSRLMKEGIIFLGVPITNEVANIVVGQLLFLSQEYPDRDITLYINSPGGSISAGMAIIDTMNLVSCDIVTNCVGMAASMAAVILGCGTKGKRYALPNSEVLIHQPWGGTHGQATDIDLYAKHIIKTRGKLNKILAAATGQPLDRIEKDVDRDFIMDADEAVAYGIVDKIVQPRPKTDKYETDED